MNLESYNKEKRGWGSRQKVKCNKYRYISQLYTLSKELEEGKPGHKP
jgi:hypothetical protein